jgi:CRISPR/Cas system-associated protein endoribonuclease Cas2
MNKYQTLQNILQIATIDSELAFVLIKSQFAVDLPFLNKVKRVINNKNRKSYNSTLDRFGTHLSDLGSIICCCYTERKIAKMKFKRGYIK